MIAEQQYKEAVNQKENCEKLIRQFHQEKQSLFDERAKNGVPFNDDELVYAAFTLCSCGYGLAYPKGCGMRGQWSCSQVLKGNGIPDEHDGPFPFAFYELKSEGQPSANGHTTRGVFRPKPN